MALHFAYIGKCKFIWLWIISSSYEELNFLEIKPRPDWQVFQNIQNVIFNVWSAIITPYL